MEKINKMIWYKLHQMPRAIIVYLVGVAFAFAMYNVYLWAVAYYPELSGVPYRMTNATIGCLMYWTVERFSFSNINSEALLATNPLAYAVLHLPYGYIIGGQLYLA